LRATVKLSVMILTAGAGWALRKCPCTTALGVPGVKAFGIQRTFRCLLTGANYTTKAATQPRTLLIHSPPGLVDAKARLVRIQLLSAQ
jgi:hypothetical protein